VEGKEIRIVFRHSVDTKNIPSTTYGTYCLYNYPAKFIPHVIAYVFENYSNGSAKIFDPFAGYGTVGSVSRVYGYDYELWDLNPMLKYFHETSLLEPKEVNSGEIIQNIQSSRFSFVPDWQRLSYWHPQEFLPTLYSSWGFYHSLEDGSYLKRLLVIPLLKVTRYFSYDDMQKQKLSQSPFSRQRISSLGLSWKEIYFRMLKKEIEITSEKITEFSQLSPKRTQSVIKSGVDVLSTDLEEHKNILITSPPYLQSQEYFRQAKLDLFWLGHKENEIKQLRKLEIPYREVKAAEILSETFELYRSEIHDKYLLKLYERYFWGVLGALTHLQEKIDDYLCIFVGRASIQGQSIPIDRICAEHFGKLGWEHKATFVDDIVSSRLFKYKKNPATQREDKRAKTENLVILKRKR